MKQCPHCKVNIGGDLPRCPLCQNSLTGEGEREYWPKLKLNTKRTKAFRIVVFSVLAVCFINLALDFIFFTFDHPSWSPIVLAWLLGSGWILENIIKKHYNLLKILFVSVLAVCVLSLLTEFYIYLVWDTPYLFITLEYIIPVLLSGNIVANFVLSFVDKHFTEHSLIFMFQNIFAGIIPWFIILIVIGLPPISWSVCLVINCLAFMGLMIFNRRAAIEEFKKRFHI